MWFGWLTCSLCFRLVRVHREAVFTAQLLHRPATGLGAFGFCRITDGDYRYGMDTGRNLEKFLQHALVEIAYPATAQSPVGSCQADVLGRNGGIDVRMVLAVARTYPGFRLYGTSNNF